MTQETKHKFTDEYGEPKRAFREYHSITYLMEIAHQVKRIADSLEEKEKISKYKEALHKIKSTQPIDEAFNNGIATAEHIFITLFEK